MSMRIAQLVFTLFVAGILSTAAASAAAGETDCKADIQCWGDKHAINATTVCRGAIERLAKYDFEWTDSLLETKFSRFRRGPGGENHVTYIGGTIKFQNGFGAWQPHIYSCEYDPVGDKVVDVKAEPGRL